MVGRFRSGKAGNDAAFAHHVDIVGKSDELFELGRRDNDNAVFLGRDASKQGVDFGLRADVDALRRLLDQKHTGIALKRARDRDLLLVATA